MIFLPGIQLFQEELDSFLNAAQKLKLNCLLSSPTKEEITENDCIKKDNLLKSDTTILLRNNIVQFMLYYVKICS